MAAATRKYKSLYSSTTNSFGTGTGETITPASVVGLPDGEISLTFDRVDSSGNATPSKMERITGTITGGNFVISARGVDGTTEQAHTTPVVEMVWNAGDWNDALDSFLTQHTASGTHAAITATSLTATGSISASNISTNTVVASTTNGDLTLDGDGTGKVRADSHYGTITSDADGATITFNMATSNLHAVTLGGNRTLAVSNVAVGQSFILRLIQDGSGSKTVTWFTTIKWAGGSAPTLTTTADKTDVIGFLCTGANTYDGFVIGQNL